MDHCYVVVLLSEDADSRSLLFLLKGKGLAKSVSVVDAVKGAAMLGLPTRDLTSLPAPAETPSSNMTAPKKPIYALVHLEDDADIDYCSTFLIEGGIAKHVTLIDDAQAASLLGMPSSHHNALLHSAASPQDDNKKASTSQLGAEMNAGTPQNVKETTSVSISIMPARRSSTLKLDVSTSAASHSSSAPDNFSDSDFNAGEIWPEGDDKGMIENDEETRGEPSVIDEDVKDAPLLLCTPLLQLPPPPSTDDVKVDLDEVDKTVNESRKRKNDGSMSNVDEVSSAWDEESSLELVLGADHEEEVYECALCSTVCTLKDDGLATILRHAKQRHGVKRYRCACYSCGYGSHYMNTAQRHQAVKHAIFEQPIDMCDANMQEEWRETMKLCFPALIPRINEYHFMSIKFDGRSSALRWFDGVLDDDDEVIAQLDDEAMAGHEEVARSVQCMMCPKAIHLGRSPKWPMISHAKRHHPQKQFRCVACSYECNASSAVYQHQVNQHGVKERPIDLTNKKLESAWMEWAARCFPVQFRQFANCPFPEKPIDQRSLAIWREKEESAMTPTPTNGYA